MPIDSEKDIADMLREYIKRSGKTQRQIADEAGVPNPSYLSHMVNGRVNWVESQYFPHLATALNLSFRDIKELRPDAVTEMMLTAIQAGAIEPPVQPANPFDYIFVEPHTLAHAGPGDSLETVPRGATLMVKKSDIKRKQTDYAYASGDSMTRPDGSGIHDGALLFVDLADLELRDGDAYLIKVPGNGFYVKRARWQFQEWWLHSDNPDYPPYQEDKAIVVGHVYRVQNPAFKP